MPPVQTEDSGHEDSVSQWFLCGGQRSVLWAVLEEPLRRGRTHCAARPGQCQYTVVKHFIFHFSHCGFGKLEVDVGSSETEKTPKRKMKRKLVNPEVESTSSFK